MNFRLTKKKIIWSIILGIVMHIFMFFTKVRIGDWRMSKATTLPEIQAAWRDPTCAGIRCLVSVNGIIILISIIILIYVIWSFFQKKKI